MSEKISLDSSDNSNKTLLPKKIPLESSSPTVLKTNYTYILI